LLGNVLFALGRGAEARTAWLESLERSPASAPAHLGLARLALEEADAGAALAQLDQVGESADSEGTAERELMKGLALLARGSAGDAQAALTAADGALRLVADEPRALFVRSGALLVLGRYSDAQASLERLQRAHPASPLGPYGLARLAAAQNRPTDVLLHLQAARRAAGSDWHAERVAADPAFAFLSTSEGFVALVKK
jgi:hypothetical protein